MSLRARRAFLVGYRYHGHRSSYRIDRRRSRGFCRSLWRCRRSWSKRLSLRCCQSERRGVRLCSFFRGRYTVRFCPRRGCRVGYRRRLRGGHRCIVGRYSWICLRRSWGGSRFGFRLCEWTYRDRSRHSKWGRVGSKVGCSVCLRGSMHWFRSVRSPLLLSGIG